VIAAAVGVVFAGPPEFAANIEVAVAIHVGNDSLVAAQTTVKDHAFEQLRCLSIDVFPDEPAGRFVARNGFHLDGEHVRVTVAIEIADGEGMIRATRNVIACF